MSLSEVEADYIAELFNVGLGEIAEEVAAIIEKEIQISVPNVDTIPSVDVIVEREKVERQMFGTFASMKLTGEFEGRGLLFFSSPDDKAFASLISSTKVQDEKEQDAVIQELSKVLLGQYVTVMVDLLNLDINCGEIELVHDQLDNYMSKIGSKNENENVISITMNFTVSSTDIQCFVVFINDHQEDEFLLSIKAALQELGL